jgi:prefoldin subunit 5
MNNYQPQIDALFERLQTLEQGIQTTTHGYRWKFCPEEVIDRLHKLENMVFHKPTPPTLAVRKMNLNDKIHNLKAEIELLYEELANCEKQYNEIHE